MDELKRTDPEIFELIKQEERYEIDSVRLIPSENYVSKAVLEATGSILTNKYSEGYPGKRYYEGQRYIDQIETLAVERAKALFNVDHANVQPYSGSPANVAVYFALLKPGDTIMGLALPHGGHLTHGWDVSITGTFWNVGRSTRWTAKASALTTTRSATLARKERPQIIVAGGTAYPRLLDFKIFGEIAKEVGAFLLADISHIAGLIVGGVHPDPVALCRRDHDDDAQDPARSARRDDHVPQASSPKRSTRRFFRACRAARTITPPPRSRWRSRKRRRPSSSSTPAKSCATRRRSPMNCSRAASASSRAAPTITSS